jgi:HD-GYP domain-containing protein (c-di-GMP phosphodiesterase class II)
MRRQVRLFVFSLSWVAVIAAAVVYFSRPSLNWQFTKAALCFAGLGALSGLLAYQKVGRSESGSIAFLPLLAAIVVAPVWITVVAAAGAMALVEIVNRRAIIKAVFNVAQAIFAVSLAILAYTGLGGLPLLLGLRLQTIAFLSALAVFVIANTVALNGVIAAAEGKSFFRLWQKHARGTLLYDLYALPFVYVFAWFYVQFGPWGAVGLVIPLLGVRELYKTNWELQKTNVELLELMVAAIEARDPYTSGHSLRVSRNSRYIAERIGLTHREIERVATAALLHDVGKIHEVFGPILSKPGRLTPEEFTIMKTHPIKSEELVGTVSRLRVLLKPIRHHHENWDGTGYPDGLAGKAIPLGSRIIMFADTIDAMTTDRPYRAALDEEAVKNELIRFRAKQFDPEICDLVLTTEVLSRLVSRTMASREHDTRELKVDLAAATAVA